MDVTISGNKCFLIMACLCLVCLTLSRSSTLAMLCPEVHPRIGHVKERKTNVTQYEIIEESKKSRGNNWDINHVDLLQFIVNISF